MGKVPLTLARLELVVVDVPMREVFRAAIGVRKTRRALLVFWTDEDGVTGVGECGCRPDPWFNGEFVDGALLVLAEHVFPQLNAARVRTVGQVLDVAARVRNWPFTIAALLDAAFDVLRRRGDLEVLDHVGPPLDADVPIGVSLPVFEDAEEAVDVVAGAVETGFARVKLKVTPQTDPELVERVRASAPSVHLGLDANGSFTELDLDLAIRLGAAADTLEQPFPPRRLDLAQHLRDVGVEASICLDESLTGLGDLVSAHRLGGLDEANIKPGRVGGVLEAASMVAFCRDNDLPCWVGGMFETGIGRRSLLAFAGRISGSVAHDLSAPSRYLVVDIVNPPLRMSNGRIRVPREPTAWDPVAVREWTRSRTVLGTGRS